MKKLILTILATLLIPFVALAFTAFYSGQVGGSASNGYVLQTDGTNSTWVGTSTLGISGGGGTPAGSTGQLQFNNGGSFGATSSPVVGYITATSTTATSTFAGSVSVTAGNISNNELTIATSSTMTINWSQGTQQLVKLGHAGVTINMGGYVAGEVLRVPLCQDGTGGATVTWDSKILWASSTPPTLSGANHCDLMTFVATAATSSTIIMGGYINF